MAESAWLLRIFPLLHLAQGASLGEVKLTREHFLPLLAHGGQNRSMPWWGLAMVTVQV
jgi:hypothetical protein